MNQVARKIGTLAKDVGGSGFAELPAVLVNEAYALDVAHVGGWRINRRLARDIELEYLAFIDAQ